MSDSSGLRAPDDYEKSYMTEKGSAVHREKSIAPWYMQILFLFPALLSIVFGVVPLIVGSPDALPHLIWRVVLAAFLVFLWLLFSVMRIAVSSSHLHVQYGIFGPKIPLENIRKAKAVHYDWRRYGGWGIRRSPIDGERIFNMMGDGGNGVRILYRDDKDKEKSILVGCAHAERLVDAIHRAQSLNHQSGQLRVASSERHDEAFETVQQESEEARKL